MFSTMASTPTLPVTTVNVAQPIIKCHPEKSPLAWPSSSSGSSANRYVYDFCTKCGVDISRFSHEDYCPEYARCSIQEVQQEQQAE
ncbi:hypothetical protein BJV82DRAFT_628395 [Fennellomyces sp. T-0311]|nr:hypothetical protein BJV82DRAFT_628395 [Fennellomyces sp. T-0311]